MDTSPIWKSRVHGSHASWGPLLKRQVLSRPGSTSFLFLCISLVWSCLFTPSPGCHRTTSWRCCAVSSCGSAPGHCGPQPGEHAWPRRSYDPFLRLGPTLCTPGLPDHAGVPMETRTMQRYFLMSIVRHRPWPAAHLQTHLHPGAAGICHGQWSTRKKEENKLGPLASCTWAWS